MLKRIPELSLVVAPSPAAAMEIALGLAIPAMIVHVAVAARFPVALEVLTGIVAGHHPDGVRIGRPSPVALVPCVPAPIRIPVTIDPGVVGTGHVRPRDNDSRRRWRTDSDSDRDLRVG